ncbi:MAG TPA: hypothetical protein VII38_13065 [Polyangia bacterium]
MHIDRIPGFAICGHCGGRRGLSACGGCGLITCADCRGDGECVVCWRERLLAQRREARRRRLADLGRRAAVIACVAVSGAAAVGAALLPSAVPDGFGDPHALYVARSEVRFVGDAVTRFSDAHEGRCPASLGELRASGYLLAAPVDPWGEPLLYGCVDGPRAFVVISKGPDRQMGTDDDLMFASP